MEDDIFIRIKTKEKIPLVEKIICSLEYYIFLENLRIYKELEFLSCNFFF